MRLGLSGTEWASFLQWCYIPILIRPSSQPLACESGSGRHSTYPSARSTQRKKRRG